MKLELSDCCEPQDGQGQEEISQQEGRGVRSKASKTTKMTNPSAKDHPGESTLIKRGCVESAPKETSGNHILLNPANSRGQ